jgi:hypothetical protein
VETIKTLEQPDGPLPRLQLILLQLETRFRSDNSFRSSLKWPFEEKDVRKIIDGVEREKSLLGLALQKILDNSFAQSNPVPNGTARIL